MKTFLIFSSITLFLFFNNELSCQNPSEILLKHNWKNLLGNQINFSSDSIQFDELTIGLKRGRKTELSDSSFICTEDYFGLDTVFYFTYVVNDDSLIMNFEPNWYKIEKGGNLSCSFSGLTFCYLVNKELKFFSETYLQRTNRKLEFEYFEGNGYYSSYFKLYNDGKFLLSTKNKPTVISERINLHHFSGRYRIFKGVYKGILAKEVMDSIKTYLRSEKGLKLYLHNNSSTDPNSEYYSIIKSEDGIFPSPSTAIMICEFIAFKSKEIYYLGLDGKKEPEPVFVKENSRVLPPSYNNNTFYDGLYAVAGNVKFIEKFRVKDSTNYLYEMEVKYFSSLIDKTIRVGKAVPFISRVKVTSDSIGFLYKKKIAHYHDIDWNEEKIKYNLAVDTFSLSKNIVFEYIDNREINDVQNFKRLETRSIRHPTTFDKYKSYLLDQKIYPPKEFFSDMDYKIAKALKRLERLD